MFDQRAEVDGCMQPGHAWLSQHYKWGLDRVFLERGHSHVIIVEDDMVFSPDFLTLFQVHPPAVCVCTLKIGMLAGPPEAAFLVLASQEAAPLLVQDPTIWCVSSWNDNGQAALGWDPQKLVCALSGPVVSHALCSHMCYGGAMLACRRTEGVRCVLHTRRM